MRQLKEGRVVTISFLSHSQELLSHLEYTRGVYLLRPTDGCCFCLRALLRKLQQTDGGYRDLLKTDTLTFKAVFLSVERNESYTTSCQPHIIVASTRLLQKHHAISRAEMCASRGIETWKRCIVKAHKILFFHSLKAKWTSVESCSHFLLIKNLHQSSC